MKTRKLRKNMVGQVFGRLKVLSRAPNKGSSVMYYCKCTCGNVKPYHYSNLIQGKTTNCGCTRYETMAEKLKKTNLIISMGDYIIGMTTNKGTEFKVDKEDWPKLKHLCWIESNHGYAIGCLPHSKYILMHRLILNVPEGKVVDHINHDRMDNRKCNLRVCDQLENSHNQQGEKGIYYNEKQHCWQSYIMSDGKHYYCGRGETRQEALEKRKEKEMELYKEFSQYYNLDKKEEGK